MDVCLTFLSIFLLGCANANHFFYWEVEHPYGGDTDAETFNLKASRSIANARVYIVRNLKPSRPHSFDRHRINVGIANILI